MRRDSRGRRIGYNWWREYINDLLFTATAAWERECEAVAIGYATEIAEFKVHTPQPTLKDFLIRNRGINREDALDALTEAS